MLKFKKRSINSLCYLFLFVLSLSLACGPDHKVKFTQEIITTSEQQVKLPNVAYRWAEIALAATANDTERFRPRPTITSRYLALIFISMFDAWTCYSSNAVPVYLNENFKKQIADHTESSKEIAVSYAAYRALSEYYFSDTIMFRNFMIELGYDPDNTSLDSSTPHGIGNRAAETVINARRNDGSNQYGEVEASAKAPYFDYTNYQCINTPDQCNDIHRWQPKYFSDGKGGKFAPECLTPFWHKVKPIALDAADQFRPGPPPMIGSGKLEKELEEVIALQANMTDQQKALVEFMRDGPSSVQQAGHWLKFAMDVSRRDHHTLDDDIKMFFLVEVTAMDAFIACWDSKMHYDFARPFALIHHLYKGQSIKGWGGPDEGVVTMDGSEWRPYSPETFVCPPFPAYVSGHSTVSGGCAEVLKLYKGSDYFGQEVKLVPGSQTELKSFGDTVTLHMPTFTETADMAGLSRVIGGYHIASDNIEGLNLGRKVAQEVWGWYKSHVKDMH